jgi:DNA-binding GntR family transcriptional regulator
MIIRLALTSPRVPHGLLGPRNIANKVLAELIALVDRRVRWYYRPIARSRGDEAWDEHKELIEVIASRNGRRASDLMRRHTERTRETYHKLSQEAADLAAMP